MSLPQLDWQTAGWWVLQHHDSTYLSTSFDHTNRCINFAARYYWHLDSDNFPILDQVANTPGPIGQWICWPGTGSRTLSQWGQVFAAKITTASPLKATPISVAAGTVDSTLSELTVTSADGTSPSVGTVGLVVAGSSLGSQEALFFTGGGGALVAMKITSGTNPYVAVEVEFPGLGVKSGGISTSAIYEINGSSVISANTFVYAQKQGSNYYFVLPMDECA